jgi:hypothetical protein
MFVGDYSELVIIFTQSIEAAAAYLDRSKRLMA